MSYSGTRFDHDCGCKTIVAVGGMKNILTKPCRRFPGCFVGKELTPKIHAGLMVKQQRQVPAS